MSEFEELYNSYYKDVYYFVLKLADYREYITEEVTQESFYQAFISLKRFRGECSIKSWLCQIAKNTYYTSCQRQRLFTGEEPSENIAAPQAVFVEQIMDEESAFQIHTFLHDMKEPYKEVFTLRIFGELPFEKIGALFGKSPSWARVVFYRAKTQIKEYMEEVDHG